MISLAFKNADKAGGFFSKAIKWKTGGPFSHVELWLSGTIYNAHCFSSREPKGTGFTQLDLRDKDLWTIVDLPGLTPAQEHDINVWCVGCGKKEYDFLGILGFVWPFGEVHDDSDLFCSECCTLCLQQVLGWFPGVKSYKTSPVKLYEMVKRP